MSSNYLQVLFRGKSRVTSVTIVLNVGDMHPLVCIQGTFLREPFQADNTLEWPLSGVSSHVDLEQREKGKRNPSTFCIRPRKIKYRHQGKKIKKGSRAFILFLNKMLTFLFELFPFVSFFL